MTASQAAQDVADGLTVDRLAQLSGMTVRNIRAHQARGLLPPPAVRGRTGYYGQDHLDRLRLILDLQSDGLNLSTVKRVLDGTPPGAAEGVLSFRRALLEPWDDEPSIILSASELGDRFGIDHQAAARGERLGILVPLGAGRYEIPHPSLIAAAEELVALGIPLAAVLGVQERLARATDAIARLFVELVEEEVWGPFAAGQHHGDWARMRDILERARPMAVRVTVANLRRSMGRAVERSLARDLRSPRRPRGRPERRG